MLKAIGIVSGLLIGVAAVSRPVFTQAPAGEVRLIPTEGEGARYWPRWRGPSGQGYVSGTNYTDTWSDTQHVKWRVAVPGLGHSSPIVWADRIFLTTATLDGSKVSMLSYRRSDGRLLWERVLPTDGVVEHVYQKNSRASATPTTDGRLVYASFGTHGLAAFDFDGKLVWHTKLGDLNNYHGSAGSPVLYKDRIFLYQDHRTTSIPSFIAAFDAATGKVLWKRDRAAQVGWGTPVVIDAGDHDELIVSSQRRIHAYNPDTGEELWTVGGNMAEVIPTPVVGHGLVFCSSGRAGPTFAIRPGGRGDVTNSHVVWTSPKGSPFVPSPLVHGEYLYLINDMQSILTVFEAKTGALMYQERLGEPVREGFSVSPVAVGNKLFFTNDNGETFVVEAGPNFKLHRVNRLNAYVLASPALVDGTWYWRTDSELIAIAQ
jgi:outer membrane protein assembly factor BamB